MSDADRTPVIADLKPSGRYTAVDFFAAGGTPAHGPDWRVVRLAAGSSVR